MMSAGVRSVRPLPVVCAALLSIAASSAPAEALRPAVPKEYQVQLRYRIRAGQTERLRQFYDLVAFLEAQGFHKDPGSDTEAADPDENRMTGTIAGSRARGLLLDPCVKSLLLLPAGYQLPAEGTVKVQIDLAGGLPPDRQRLLEDQVRARLALLNFQDKVGYDNRGHTRLLGTVPVEEVGTLLKDLRGQPAGWLAPITSPTELPQPLRDFSPLRVTEVLPEPEGVAAARAVPAETPPPAEGRDFLLKITPELRDLAMQEGQAEPRRLDVILDHSPTSEEHGWRSELAGAVPGLVIEGRLGPLVTVLASPKVAPVLAELPGVSTVRLARPALIAGAPIENSPRPLGERGRGEGKGLADTHPSPPTPLPQGARGDYLEILRASGLDRLHNLGHRGKGVRVAVIDGDFRGYQGLLGKQLPAGTRYIDLTAERNPNLEPDPFPGEPNLLGHGTQCALAVLLAAPQVELTLIRIDPAAPHQLQEAARYLNGEDFRSESSFRRSQELTDARTALLERKAQLEEERKIVLGKFIDISERENLKKKKDKLTPEEREQLQDIERHDAFFQNLADYERDEKALRERTRRYLDLQSALHSLQDVKVVAASLVWNEGLPLGNDSSLSRYFDDRPFRAALWFQSAGSTRGQAWSGLFRDDDGNGVMEFAPATNPPRPQRWTPELNFLAWQPHGRPSVPELPEKAKLRLTMQWREPHEPEFFRLEKDLYREPLAKLRLVVLRQRDPKGEKLAADDFEVIARSEGLPQRLENQPTYAVYEQAVEFVAEPAGRYALRVEGRVPASTRPSSLPALPSMARTWELRPRLFVEVADPAFRAQGRAVFVDYPTEIGALGTPADAREVITVGAADAQGKPQPASTEGSPFHAELSVKPDVLGYEGFLLPGLSAIGTTDQAVSFAAGLTAASLSAGKTRATLLRTLRTQGEKPVKVP